MFGKKPQPTPPPSVAVTAIPGEFYGGANPVVKFKEVAKEVDMSVVGKSSISPTDKKLHDQQTARGSGKAFHATTLLSNRRFLIIAGIVLFLGAAGGVSAFYLIPYFRKPLPRPTAPRVTVTTPTSSEPLTSPVVIAPVVSSTPTTTPLREAGLEFPSILLSDSVDADNDGLTDREEEEVFNTDPGVPDTDNDNYQDGHEAYYLYNPAGKEPERLLDAGLVKDYDNPVWHYQIYYPSKWALGNIDNEYRELLWSTLSGENVELRIVDKKSETRFEDWFAEWAPREKFADLISFESYFKVKGYSRSDYLVYYFPTTDKVFVLLYHAAPDTTAINYRSVIKMMARSFRLPSGNSSLLTEPLPREVPLTPASSTSSTSASASSSRATSSSSLPTASSTPTSTPRSSITSTPRTTATSTSPASSLKAPTSTSNSSTSTSSTRP